MCTPTISPATTTASDRAPSSVFGLNISVSLHSARPARPSRAAADQKRWLWRQPCIVELAHPVRRVNRRAVHALGDLPPDDASTVVKRNIDDYIESAGLQAPPAEDDPAETIAPRLLTLESCPSIGTQAHPDHRLVHRIQGESDGNGVGQDQEYRDAVSACTVIAGLAFVGKSSRSAPSRSEAVALVDRIVGAARSTPPVRWLHKYRCPYPSHGPE